MTHIYLNEYTFIFSLIFDFINGFHDTANAVATA
ncbi:hypothetical protein, partial [Staphylococcus aureus]